MNSNRLIFASVLLAAATAGCVDSHETPAPTTAPAAAMTNSQPRQRAQCLVCKDNADLACLDVDVDSNTPRYAYNGRTYYFCSEECRQQFVKNPGKYAALADK